ncbi:arsenical pump-driving ATPase, putative [Plasmodium vivax]|uniref:ATPase ASNA1 homolog n=6 Tax=Plasmodium vivax TaxID=5855 RepID=ASNA_PLAVS|nr:arsenical pump-driving ATPase, putative [Plasmodium vivax]A5K5W9.1 RecName: Full=ATPase ASNA1 homolog; AltName: Full=Arsenical pump-driving ATPase homolog; AltName: Full=Arsenite-stimulated ATPase [Plasmodium vivax Sal-1]KMZ81893.1 ATPase ASNA1 [Plasmodium vivax India VII]KMZ88179.1 ATPase ASNA1 [Plasmodium vivax Brazil I]KMZ94554.1 ATPase ASNA1 [Plasmodium vivax Mauritania I]KNA01094.1 ATPase ASNA1 [Plasmodium vivax North Korean]EDL45304.1 arsenical pump-driving ATPase, putative [Plasmodi|eukprot:XP_001615031.1 arsenical pump-driving ATPase [Plasmodium vivax Sal-1]
MSDADSLSCSLTLESDEYDEEEYDTNLSKLLENKTLNWIFVGGKGGVGKTTTSCSIAVQLAKRRESVLLLSTDPAHNTSDAFNQKFTNQPTLINSFDNLYCMEIDTTYSENTAFKLNKTEFFDNIIPELLQSFPGIDEALCFAELMQSIKNMKYSVIVFDTAPTGHTLRLLAFPELLKKALGYLINLREKLKGTLNMLKSFTNNEMELEGIYEKINHLNAMSISIQSNFQNPLKTTFVCVCIPEFLSVYETERLIQELTKKNISCYNIVVNQVVFPLDSMTVDVAHCEGLLKQIKDKQVQESFSSLVQKTKELEDVYISRRKLQSKYLTQIKNLYGNDFHIVCMPQLKSEIRGLQNISNFSEMLLESKEIPIYR